LDYAALEERDPDPYRDARSARDILLRLAHVERKSSGAERIGAKKVCAGRRNIDVALPVRGLFREGRRRPRLSGVAVRIIDEQRVEEAVEPIGDIPPAEFAK
jgi:hypothetical protein